MESLSKIKKKLVKYKKYLKNKYNIKSIAIFGSFVRGEQKKKSDLDILVEFSEPIDLFEFIRLEEELSNLIGIKVDLVSKKALKPYIEKYILREAIEL